eukprot:TRINITY_DN14048_c0_g1_i3.p1 TRINITY_DN14048_c0_g1~~TRINITY_DN14048_c0_g1_i3.p1  ORF type:complete len:249 (-),score=42.12 TRINITY_DN14048_c0_g1_i3:43-789(-)
MCIRDSNSIEETVIRLEHILKNEIIGEKAGKQIDEQMIKNLLNLLDVVRLNKVSLRCLIGLSRLRNKELNSLMLESGLFDSIQKLLQDQTMISYTDEMLELFFQILNTLEASSNQPLITQIIDSAETLKQLTIFAYSTLNKIISFQDKSEELAKRKKRGRKAKRGPKSTKKHGELIQGEGLDEIIATLDPSIVKEHALWMLKYFEENIQDEKFKGRLANAVIEQYQNCLLYTSPSPRDRQKSRMPSSA